MRISISYLHLLALLFLLCGMKSQEKRYSCSVPNVQKYRKCKFSRSYKTNSLQKLISELLFVDKTCEEQNITFYYLLL